MTGIGRAWGIVPKHVVQTLARYSDHGRVHTNIKLPWSTCFNSEHKCPLRCVRIPIERIKWHTTQLGHHGACNTLHWQHWVRHVPGPGRPKIGCGGLPMMVVSSRILSTRQRLRVA